MSPRTLIILATAVVLVGGSWYLVSREGAGDNPNQGFNSWNQPVAVRTVPAVREDLTLQVRAIGTVVPFNTVVVRSRVEGPLLRVLIREGQQVRAGQLLAEIDPEPYRIRLAQAEGAQQQNVAQLRNAELELEQYERVIEAGTIPRQTLDRQRALVNQLRGTLQSDQAQVDTARLQLDYTRITAPISGRVGLRRVDPGNLVGPGNADGLFTITQTQPISVLMSIPEAELPPLREALAAGRRLTVEAWDRSGSQLLAEGVLSTLDNQIDTATGTLRLKAQFGNEDDALFPNQFVNTVLEVGAIEDAVTIPADAVQHGSAGTYVYTIEGGRAKLRDVLIGATVDGRTAVREGIAAGEPVVLEGIDRLREGSEVRLVDGPPGPQGAGEVASGDVVPVPAS
jgi:multidrug efflux system membrane fusion protein